MKKSKEYFSELKEVFKTNSEQEIKAKTVEIFKQFINVEIPELAEMRHVQTEAALQSIIDEQNRKWNSLCDKCEEIGVDILIRDAVKACTAKVDLFKGDL